MRRRRSKSKLCGILKKTRWKFDSLSLSVWVSLLTAHYLICLDLMNKSHVKGKYGIVHVLIETEDLLTIPQRLTDEGSAMASVVPPPYIW